MSLIGEAVRNAREGFGLKIRELGRRAGVSPAQISRIESGAVERPSMDTLIAIARALDRNPRPLLIVSGHTGHEEAREYLLHLLRPHAGEQYDPDIDSELVADWEHGAQSRLDAARAVLADPESSHDDVRSVAVDVFSTYETEETFWWESWLAPLLEQSGGEELRELVGLWQSLPQPPRDKLIEYARDQAELVRARRLGELATSDEEA